MSKSQEEPRFTKFITTYRPAADGGIWTVLSPNGTSVFRSSSIEEATAKADERNGVVR